MSNTIRIVNLSASPVAVPLFTDVVDPSEERSSVQKTVNADDLVLAGLHTLGVAALVDGSPVTGNTQEHAASVTLVLADLVDGERNLLLVDASGGAVTITLPLTTTLTDTTEVWVYAVNVDNALNVDDDVADTIAGGAGPVALAAVGDVLRLSSDGPNNDWVDLDA